MIKERSLTLMRDEEVGRGMVIASTRFVSNIVFKSYGAASDTKPQPLRIAPFAERIAAPVCPAEPATIRR